MSVAYWTGPRPLRPRYVIRTASPAPYGAVVHATWQQGSPGETRTRDSYHARGSTWSSTASSSYFVLVVLVSCTGGDRATQQRHHRESRQEGRAGRPATTRSDAEFLKVIIGYHEQAVEISDIALARATGPEVKAFARSLKAAHDPEVNKLKDLLSAHDGELKGKDDAFLDVRISLTGQELERLRRARGGIMSQTFLDTVIVHHERGLSAAHEVLRDGGSAPATDLARQMVREERAELAEAERLRQGSP